MGIGGSEIFIIMLFALMFFGADKIPEIAKGLGKAMREFKKASDDIKAEINNSMVDVKSDLNDIKEDLTKSMDPIKEDINKTIQP
jgi:sec-independent protein translocase protein TatA